MPAPQKLTPQQQRDKRAKIMLGLLVVPFLGLMAFQLLKIMNAGGGSPPPPAAATPTTPGAPGVPTPATVGALVTAAGPATTGQLVHFSYFASKNPFTPKVAVAGAGSSTTPGVPGSTPTVTPAAPKKTAIAKKALTVSVTQSPPANAKPKSKAAAAVPIGPQIPAALLMVNGKKQVLGLDTGFPATRPLFRIISLSKNAVWIQLIGGTFANGSRTMKLQRGHKVTLVNTTAGVRYVITMVKPTTAPAPTAVVQAAPTAVAPAAAAPAATTAATTTTTPTTTTPGSAG